MFIFAPQKSKYTLLWAHLYHDFFASNVTNNNFIIIMKHKRNRHSINALFLDLSVAAASLLCLTGCQEEFGGYFDQPGWVTSSSEDVLKSRGDCNTYLQLVGKTLFSKQVEGSGQYTFIVPTDEAFSAFFANNPYGYRSVDDIPEDVAARMVSSWMMYNSYPCDTLANVLQGFNTYGVNEAFKHKTPSYDVLREEVVDGVKCQVYEFPYSSSSFSLKDNALSWNNYRYLPIFTSRYNNNNSITSSDWTKVVGSEFSPYGNYVDAGIIDAHSGSANPGDLFCQNGVIHLVNKVVMPLENLDAMIRTYGDGSAIDEPEKAKSGAWSLLRNLLYLKQGNGEYLFVAYQKSDVAKNYFAKAYPDVDLSNFYVRAYTTASPFLLNCEDYTEMALPLSGSTLFYTQYNGGMTFYVPQKDVLLNYINNRLFRYSGVTLAENATQEEFNAAFSKLSATVPVALWSSMMADGMIWPSQFETSAVNSVGSSEHINGYDNAITYDNNVVAAGIASNGMWQITNFVPKTAAFEGVAARLLLDPAYSNEMTLISQNYNSTIFANLLKSKLAGMDDVNLSLILWGDENAKWWDNIHYSTLLSAFATGDLGSEVSVNGSYLGNIRNGYIERETVDALDLEVDPLNGAYGGWAYTNNYYGGVMRYRKSGKTINGQPEIQIQTPWTLMNDPQERTLYESGLGAYPSATLQTYEPTANCYTSVVKDNGTDYVNGNVYVATEHTWPLDYLGRYSNAGNTFGDGYTLYNSTLNTLGYLRAYLMADDASATPRHTLFKKFFDYYDANKSKRANCDTLATGAGKWTVFVPTDEALQAAIDYAKSNDITLLRHPDRLPADPLENDANWVDSVICILSAYITKSGCFPDDGLSALYETSEAWDGLSASNRQAPKQYLVTTINKITDVDRVVNGKPQKPWDGLITGATMSGYVAKTGDGNKLQYFGRPYTSGAFQVVDVYNSSDILPDQFDNTVVREAGQSNIMAYDGIIHSLNGFIIYKIASH